MGFGFTSTMESKIEYAPQIYASRGWWEVQPNQFKWVWPLWF